MVSETRLARQDAIFALNPIPGAGQWLQDNARTAAMSKAKAKIGPYYRDMYYRMYQRGLVSPAYFEAPRGGRGGMRGGRRAHLPGIRRFTPYSMPQCEYGYHNSPYPPYDCIPNESQMYAGILDELHTNVRMLIIAPVILIGVVVAVVIAIKLVKAKKEGYNAGRIKKVAKKAGEKAKVIGKEMAPTKEELSGYKKYSILFPEGRQALAQTVEGASKGMVKAETGGI